MVVARNNSESFPYVLKAEREFPPEKQTTFRLRRLSTRQHLLLANLQGEDEAGTSGVKVGTAMVAGLQIGIAGWSNFTDEHGAQIEFKPNKGKHLVEGIPAIDPASLQQLDLLPTDAAQELAAAILKANEFTPDDRKN